MNVLVLNINKREGGGGGGTLFLPGGSYTASEAFRALIMSPSEYCLGRGTVLIWGPIHYDNGQTSNKRVDLTDWLPHVLPTDPKKR